MIIIVVVIPKNLIYTLLWSTSLEYEPNHFYGVFTLCPSVHSMIFISVALANVNINRRSREY